MSALQVSFSWTGLSPQDRAHRDPSGSLRPLLCRCSPPPMLPYSPRGVQVGCQGRRRSPGSSPAWLAFCRGREDI